MRRVFYSLILINCILLIWRSVFGLPENYLAPKPPPSYVPPRGVAPVLMVGESPANANIGLGSAPANPALCSYVGPFAEMAKAQTFKERLAVLDVEARLQSLEAQPSKTYWLYLEGSGEPKAARATLADLKKRDIDSYIFPEGEMNHGISLGVFRDRASAMAQMAFLANEGLTPKLKTEDRAEEQLWVAVKQPEVQKISKKLWQKLIKTQFKLQEKQKPCLDVASE